MQMFTLIEIDIKRTINGVLIWFYLFHENCTFLSDIYSQANGVGNGNRDSMFYTHINGNFEAINNALNVDQIVYKQCSNQMLINWFLEPSLAIYWI